MDDRYIYIIRICLVPLGNALTLDNLQVFTKEDDAIRYGTDYMKTYKLSTRDVINEFNDQNRYYIYEDFIGEQFIWIERHIIII